MKIAFVGLGRMGAGMTHRLLDAGHEVHAWNRSEGPRATLASQGGTPAASLPELVANLGEERKAVWVMVPSGDVTEQTIDLGQFKAGYFEVEIAFRQHLCQFAHFLGQQPAIPPRIAGDFVIGYGEGTLFCIAEPGQPQ